MGTVTKLRSHFKHNIFMLDEAGELLEHLGGTEDYLLAAELYEVTLKRWPTARIQMRQGARIVYDSMRVRPSSSPPPPSRRAGRGIALRRAFEDAGVLFLERTKTRGPGVCHKE